jgi:hypothetical protein
MRPIDADALINRIVFHSDLPGDQKEVFEDEINAEPSIEPERKTGRWLSDNRPGGGFWVCSCCKFPSEAFAANVLYKFCPNCGADMRGGEDEA